MNGVRSCASEALCLTAVGLSALSDIREIPVPGRSVLFFAGGTGDLLDQRDPVSSAALMSPRQHLQLGCPRVVGDHESDRKARRRPLEMCIYNQRPRDLIKSVFIDWLYDRPGGYSLTIIN